MEGGIFDLGIFDESCPAHHQLVSKRPVNARDTAKVSQLTW